jgi:hypothetical protein
VLLLDVLPLRNQVSLLIITRSLAFDLQTAFNLIECALPELRPLETANLHGLHGYYYVTRRDAAPGSKTEESRVVVSRQPSVSYNFEPQTFCTRFDTARVASSELL